MRGKRGGEWGVFWMTLEALVSVLTSRKLRLRTAVNWHKIVKQGADLLMTKWIAA